MPPLIKYESRKADGNLQIWVHSGAILLTGEVPLWDKESLGGYAGKYTKYLSWGEKKNRPTILSGQEYKLSFSAFSTEQERCHSHLCSSKDTALWKSSGWLPEVVPVRSFCVSYHRGLVAACCIFKFPLATGLLLGSANRRLHETEKME